MSTAARRRSAPVTRGQWGVVMGHCAPTGAWCSHRGRAGATSRCRAQPHTKLLVVTTADIGQHLPNPMMKARPEK